MSDEIISSEFQSERMATAGEMACGVALEIDKQLKEFILAIEQLRTLVKEEPLQWKERAQDIYDKMQAAVDDIAAIVHVLRSFSRDGTQKDVFSLSSLEEIIQPEKS